MCVYQVPRVSDYLKFELAVSNLTLINEPTMNYQYIPS
jgi:hypothetical protein